MQFFLKHYFQLDYILPEPVLTQTKLRRFTACVKDMDVYFWSYSYICIIVIAFFQLYTFRTRV